ncbi:MAG TPA: DUF4347 domain-containing protein [Xenococcaceae cyanobacterium]
MDDQEFFTPDFDAINSKSLLQRDISTVPRNPIGGELGNERLIIIDSAVSISEPQIETFWHSDAEVVQLDANQDGVMQITDILATRQNNISTIDIFSHGSAGNLQLGNATINSETLDQYRSSLTGWTGVSQTADILLYGCEVGQGEEGRQFVEQFSTLTGADIAASEDLTGSANYNGDWELEYQTGSIESTTLAIEEFDSVLSSSPSMLKNSNFNQALDGTNWLVGKTGKVREYDQNVAKVAYVDNVPGQGRQMYLKLPQEAKLNYYDQLSLFQDVYGLETDKVYAVEARVKWLNPENKLPSAIVSFWAQNPDKSFRGKDFTITDGNGYKNLRFEFTPTQAGKTRFFLGLFTHTQGNIDDTEIFVDDYQVTEVSNIAQGEDSRQGNLLGDSGFNNYTAKPKVWTAPGEGWNYTVESPVPGLKQSVFNANGNNKLRLELPKAKNDKDEFNTAVTGVYQNVDLVGGQTYELAADFQRLALNQFVSQKNSIVQFMVYRERSNGEQLFLGPIDVELTNNNLQSKKFSIVAPDSGNYTVLVRLAGWANEGNGVVVEVDNVSLKPKN